MAEVQLSDGLNTREDAEKIVKALWDEAVEREWEDKLREVVRLMDDGNLLPVAGYVERTLWMVPGHGFPGVTGEVLALVGQPGAEVRFRHRVETRGEGGACCCPEEQSGAELVLSHAREVLANAGKAQYLNATPRSPGTYSAQCSSVSCVNS